MSLLDILEAARPWWTAGAASGAAVSTTGIWLKWKRLKLTEKLEDRQGFGILIEALQTDVTNLRAEHKEEIAAMRADHAAEVAIVRAEHRECQDRLNKIEGELQGFHRQAVIRSNNDVTLLPASTMVKDAGDRAVAHVTKLGEQDAG